MHNFYGNKAKEYGKYGSYQTFNVNCYVHIIIVMGGGYIHIID